MRSEKESVLISLSDHTEVIHQALEGKNLSFEERMIYLGHLGMCARLFKAVCLGESRELIDPLIRIEQSSFRLGTPSDQRGLIARESWSLLEPVLIRYLNYQTTQAEQDVHGNTH
jgi:hypothetical protein